MISLPNARPWISLDGKLCENPLWDVATQTLYWTDIDAGLLYSHDWVANQTTQIYQGPKVGGFTFQADGSLLLFRTNDIAVRHRDGRVEVRATFSDDRDARFNDVIADPVGRVFAGTIGTTSTSGALYRVDLDGSRERVVEGTGCSNGMAFSPDLGTFYWVCSSRRKVFAFPYDSNTGRLGDSRVVYESDDGIPDGLTIDREGNLYLARWEASEYRVIVLSANGEVLGQQQVGAKCTTSACFCGPELKHLAITSAALVEDPDRTADLFLMTDLPIPGRAEFVSRIFLD